MLDGFAATCDPTGAEGRVARAGVRPPADRRLSPQRPEQRLQDQPVRRRQLRRIHLRGHPPAQRLPFQRPRLALPAVHPPGVEQQARARRSATAPATNGSACRTPMPSSSCSSRANAAQRRLAGLQLAAGKLPHAGQMLARRALGQQHAASARAAPPPSRAWARRRHARDPRGISCCGCTRPCRSRRRARHRPCGACATPRSSR